MFGLIIAFKDYSAFQGFWRSPWVGMAHFRLIFDSPDMLRIFFNTIYLNILQLSFAFPAGILMALMLNEVKNSKFKQTVQSLVYLPHFVSWIVVVGLAVTFLGSNGIVNSVLKLFNHEPVSLLTSPSWFMPLITIEGMWKETGWGTIIFLAALAGINPHLYEAAVIDGANRWHAIRYITLPTLRGTIAILLILQLGHVLDTGLEQILLMVNSLTKEVGTTLDLYVFQRGIEKANYSFATAFGLFKSLIGLLLILGANRLAKKVGEEGVF
jgi:putative aldouronate transport system permease protein